ncbi:hypothetical protein B0H13DRAFT_1853972 [Mycena leptocephala]|nr:hypothetical protein B0H13DRAFT_1853972 [Mycena leptocephala]
MPLKNSITQMRLKNVTTCLTVTADTLEMLANNFKIPLLEPISNTTQSLLKCIEAVKQNKGDCVDLIEKTNNLLNAIIIVYIKSDTGADLPPPMLNHIGRFTETLHKIHTFVEAQQNGSKIKKIFRQGEISTLLTECNAGLQHAHAFFQLHTVSIMTDITEMQENAQKRHEEVLQLVEGHSDAASSDQASFISRIYSDSYKSSNSISMLPAEPKIFHGRESELSDILRRFSQVTPRIAILGAGGMGKTSLARAIIHHADLVAKYEEHRFFVACDSAATKVELAALIGAHLGIKPGKDLTRPVIQHFSSHPPSLLILDNLETLWEPAETRGEIEEFLSLLTDVDHLALVITMRGAERPTKVAWTRPFLVPLKPLEQEAARQTFIDIADDWHSPEEVDKVLSLTDNLPLAISLLANLVDLEGCSNVLSRWEEEKTSLISDGYDKRSNLDLSISLSLSSPRIKSIPQSQELLSLLSILPDGLSDVELVQSRFPIDNILGCKMALIRTSLAYSDEHNQLKALVPIREHMQKIRKPGDHLIQPLLKHFQGLLEFYVKYRGSPSGSGIVARISSNYSNIQDVLRVGLQQGHADLKDSIYCTCHLNVFSRYIGRQGPIQLIVQVQEMLPELRDHHVEAYFITEMLSSWTYYPLANREALVSNILELLEQVDDIDLKCRIYMSVADHYQIRKQDMSSAIKFCQTAVSLAVSTRNTNRHSQGLQNLARLKFLLGDYSAAQMHAHESQRLARISADFFREALALRIKATCLRILGDYKQHVSLCDRARDLIRLCGASGGQVDYDIMNLQAEVHKLKSEYVEARRIHNGFLQQVPKDQNPYDHAFVSLNIAEIDLAIGTPQQNILGNVEAATEQFNTMGLAMEVTMCETILADLYLREGNLLAADSLLKECIKSSMAHPDIIAYCLERLGDVGRWKVPYYASSWTTVYFVHSLKFKEKLGIHRALQFLGDIFRASDDEDTAISLYTVALEGFTQMDVHRSRAECMLHLGDISKGYGDLLRALELWETARPLFERSSQAKQVENIDERLASVGDDMLEQHRKNLACLAELIVPSAAVEDPEDEVSDIEDLDVDLNKVKSIQLVAKFSSIM